MSERTLLELGWQHETAKRLVHVSGASVELEGNAVDGTLTARINDGEPVPVRSLSDALDLAHPNRHTVDDYERFIEAKRVEAPSVGLLDVPELNAKLFGFQREQVAWTLHKGRAALFLGCGMGKTPIQLEWARVVSEHTGRPVLILAPLAVSVQTVREGEKFGIKVTIAREQSDVTGPGIYVTNYERLDKFDTKSFAGVVLDESSILKAFMGSTKRALVEAFRDTHWKLCCTATPAPNDHMELGNHAEFLGIMPGYEMLTRWFINDTSHFGNYRLKGHAVHSFWDWVASWARMAETPADLGHEQAGYDLPELDLVLETVDVDLTDGRKSGELFRMPSMNATAIHQEKRRTAGARAALLGSIVEREPGEAWLIWTDTDYEAAAVRDALEPLGGITEVKGGDSVEKKERALLGFADGNIKRLLTKPKLAGFGMNWQACARVAFVGPSFSYEQFYQAVRRVWRFGQTRNVRVHVILAQTERHIWDVVSRKSNEHDDMKREMRAAMLRAQAREHSLRAKYQPRHIARVPAWLRSDAA